MDKLLENARLYLKILCKASSPQIKDWKQDDLANALKWPAYFQKAYNQLQQKPKWLYKLDTELSRIAQKENCRFSSDVVVSMQFLGNSQDYICKVLLCNPNLPVALFHSLVMNSADLQKYCTEVILESLLCDVLQEMSDILE